jgi:hypothetical protein
MCRNIKMLHNFEPPATDEEVHLSSLQFVRKLSGCTRPSKANQAAFDRAVDKVTRASYNEWIVKDYTVLGIFAHPPCIADDVAGLPRRITLEELVQHFPGQPIFSFKDGSIYRLRPPPSAPIDPSEIYPEPA